MGPLGDLCLDAPDINHQETDLETFKDTCDVPCFSVNANERKKKGKFLLLTVGAILLTVELLCLQSIKVPLRHTFPFVSKEAQLRARKARTVSETKKHITHLNRTSRDCPRIIFWGGGLCL